MALGYIKHLSTNHGEQHLLATELLLGDLEEVVLENNNIGQLALLQ
jgi:hypothetical protein